MKLENWEFKHKRKREIKIIHGLEPNLSDRTFCGYAIDGDMDSDGFQSIGETDKKINCPDCIAFIKLVQQIKL
jgi:hypothetical protein